MDGAGGGGEGGLEERYGTFVWSGFLSLAMVNS